MVFRNFRWNVFIRLGFILLMLALLAYLLVVSNQYIRGIYLGVLIVIVLIELFLYVDRRNRELVSFLEALRNEDSTIRFMEKKKGGSFAELFEIMNEVSEKFRILRRDRELQFQYLQALLEHVKVGILSFDENGQIYMINKAFKNYMASPDLKKDLNIKILQKDFVHLLTEIKSEDRKIYEVKTSTPESTSLVIQASEFKLGDQNFKLVSAQNIKQELDQQEIIAWQKLIRTLTHEIMNSVTPVSSLSASLYSLLKKDPDLTMASYKTLLNGLEAIMDRSQGLMNFTEAYKTMTRIPPPKLSRVEMTSLLKRMETLFGSIVVDSELSLVFDHKVSATAFNCDLELLDLVLINIFNNAVDAVQGNPDPEILISITDQPGAQIAIRLEDNGSGMDSETLEQIYVPFFTTKTKGTGIGLSLSNQIVRSLNGYITVESKPGKGSVFRIII